MVGARDSRDRRVALVAEVITIGPRKVAVHYSDGSFKAYSNDSREGIGYRLMVENSRDGPGSGTGYYF